MEKQKQQPEKAMGIVTVAAGGGLRDVFEAWASTL